MIGDRDKIAQLKLTTAMLTLALALWLILDAKEDRERERARQDRRYTDVLSALFAAEEERDALAAELGRERRTPRFRGHPDRPPEIAE